jgi:WD40 repeat protein
LLQLSLLCLPPTTYVHHTPALIDDFFDIWKDGKLSITANINRDHSQWVLSVAFPHDSTLLASASDDDTFKIWKASSGVCLQTLEGHSNGVRSVAFSHGSTRLASASYDDTVKLWDASSGACLQMLEGHSSGVSSVAFSHDSTRLASASNDSTVKIWDVSSGACLQNFNGHRGSVRWVAFSHDSTRLASASNDSTVKIWDVSSGACLRTLEGHRQIDNLVGFETQQPIHQGVGISADGTSITHNQKQLRLPLEYSPECSAVSGRYVAIGTNSGKVWIFCLK